MGSLAENRKTAYGEMEELKLYDWFSRVRFFDGMYVVIVVAP